MKKRVLAMVLALGMTFGLAGCAGSDKATDTSDKKAESADTESKDELTTVKWNYGSSGNVLVTIAEEEGYFEDEGIKIEPVEATQNMDAMALLAAGKVDVVSNAGTSNPLQQIAQGVDLTIFGGHMVEGCMPVIAKAGTEWNGIESFIGESVAVNPSYFAFTGAVMDLGYDNPLDVVDWKVYSSYDDALVAVQNGEVKYALMGTQNNYGIKELVDAGEIEIVSYQSEIMENYSCCRMVGQTEWVNDNPDTVKAIIRALLRAQSWYEANKEEAVSLHAKKIGQDDDYVAAYMLDDEHYFVNVDPLKNSVVRAWGILDKTGYLGDDCQINIEDHINTDLYEEALSEAKDAYGDEAPDFYDAQQKFFEENDK
ncbi:MULTISPECIES: ABC transporter substrate-binding protein [unclassified Dorea]|uniref:ABC transporter substrate-binding protein n=1 Tax=unclassified Dorea TaxID=2627917 RepID=UPI000E5330C0|nr:MULTISPECIES: ABC transporter substrate-binding protein [unclassified Dorea]RGY81697.1 ABC transporter substrate-binding protein [Dorea sp. AM58-8]RHP08741.1 ABC transporter substrate-binding protein [Dorea sp. AF36-15AT]